MRVFNDLKEEIEKTLLYSTEENIPFFVESYASVTVEAAVLNQWTECLPSFRGSSLMPKVYSVLLRNLRYKRNVAKMISPLNWEAFYNTY